MNTFDLSTPSEWMSTSHILLVDDNDDNRSLLKSMLEWAGYSRITSCSSSREALQNLFRYRPDLVILDLMMPEIDGFEFLRRVRGREQSDPFLPILVYTADLSPDARTKALNLGASDFLTKPGDAIEIQLRVRNFLKMRKLHHDLEVDKHDLEAKVALRTKHLNIARQEAVEILARACDYRDDETGQHSRRVGQTSAAIALEMGLDLDFVESIRLAALLHDVGKIAVPDGLLFKPGPLTEDEAEVMRMHVVIGASLFGQTTSPLLQMAKEIAEFHHESYSGDGYCAGLKGDQIPLPARIVAVADAFDAMTHDRPYRKAMTTLDAVKELKACSGGQFDPQVVLALFRSLARPGRDVSLAA